MLINFEKNTYLLEYEVFCLNLKQNTKFCLNLTWLFFVRKNVANLAQDSRVCFFLAEVIGDKRIFVFSYLQNRRLFFVLIQLLCSCVSTGYLINLM